MRNPRKSQSRRLESRLRSERPQPSESLLRMLSPQSAASTPESRGTALPWPAAAVAFAATAVLVASLVAGGTTGYATRSLRTFGRNLTQVMHSSRTAPVGVPDLNSGDTPSRVQLGAAVGICERPLIVEVPTAEVFYRLLHGAKPASACFGSG